MCGCCLFFSATNFLALQDSLGLSCKFSVQSLNQPFIQGALAPFHWRTVLETGIWTPGVPIAPVILLLLCTPSWQREEIQVCLLTSVYIRLCNYFYMQLPGCKVSQTWVHTNVFNSNPLSHGHSCLFSSHIYISNSTITAWTVHHPFTYSISTYMFDGIRIVNLHSYVNQLYH